MLIPFANQHKDSNLPTTNETARIWDFIREEEMRCRDDRRWYVFEKSSAMGKVVCTLHSAVQVFLLYEAA